MISYEDFRKILDIPKSYDKPTSIKTKILKKVSEDFKKIGINFTYDFTKDKRYDGNYIVTLKTDKNDDDLLLWLNSKEKYVKTIKEIDDKVNLIEAETLTDPTLPF